VFERGDGADRLLVALNNGEVAGDLRDVLVDAGWPDVDLLDDAEVVIEPGWSSAEGADVGAATAAEGPGAGSDPLRIPGVDSLVLRLTTP
jgi:hypothetical protein